MNERDLDAPTPPGGPQRTDAPAGDSTPGTPAPDPGPGAERVTKPDSGEQDAIPDPSGDRPEQSAAAQEQQLENAESSLDQPSA